MSQQTAQPEAFVYSEAFRLKNVATMTKVVRTALADLMAETIPSVREIHAGRIEFALSKIEEYSGVVK